VVVGRIGGRGVVLPVERRRSEMVGLDAELDRTESVASEGGRAGPAPKAGRVRARPCGPRSAAALMME
jgi:hypothetical protein